MKKLYFKERVFKLDHYPIENENGDVEYYIDQDLGFSGYKIRVSDADGVELFNIMRKMISFMPRYTADFDNGDTLVVQKQVSYVGNPIDVFFDGNLVTLTGDVAELNYEVENVEGKVIGEVHEKITSISDAYELTVHDPEFERQLIALTICMNNINDTDETSTSS